MADSDYTVAVVLQASDEGMSTTLKKSADGIEDVGKKSQQAKVDMMAAVVAMEGMTSGLNQVTGGMRKYSSALVQTNKISQEQADHFNKNIAMMELVTGPLETMIALQKMATIISHSESAARIKETLVKSNLMIVNNSLIMSMAVWLVIIIAVIAVLYLLYKIIFDTENTMKAFGDGIDKVKDGMMGMVQVGKEGVQMFIDLHMAAFEALEPLTRVVSIVPGFGGD